MATNQVFEAKRLRCDGTVSQEQLNQFAMRLHVSAAYQAVDDQHLMFQGVGHVLIEDNLFESVWNPYVVVLVSNQTIIVVQAVEPIADDSDTTLFAAVVKSGPKWSLEKTAVMISGPPGTFDHVNQMAETMEWRIKLLSMIFDKA